MKKTMIGLLMLLSACSSAPTKWVKCNVVSHHVTSDEYGTAHYNTAVSCEDGKYHNVMGMTSFHAPIGSKMYYSEEYLDWH